MKPNPIDSLRNLAVGIKDKIATVKKFISLAVVALGLSACTPGQENVSSLGLICIGGAALTIGIAVAHVLDP